MLEKLYTKIEELVNEYLSENYDRHLKNRTEGLVLVGKKGNEKLYVNNVGKVIKTVKGTKPKAGNDLYLSIDADLQKAVYNILEQKLAGILVTKIQNQTTFEPPENMAASKYIIPITDVYFALINNNVIDIKIDYNDKIVINVLTINDYVVDNAKLIEEKMVRV